MLAKLRELRPRIEQALEGPPETRIATIEPLRIATAQLLLLAATAAGLERLGRGPNPGHLATREGFPAALAWGPLLVGPLAAATQLRAARRTSGDSGPRLLLNGACVALGGAIVAHDLLRARYGAPIARPAPLAFAAAGLLGIALDRHVHDLEHTERELRRRASVVERLVPRRRARLDRVVVHV
jgi:hypothetical protein